MKKDLKQLFDEFIFECEFARILRPETLRGYRQTFEIFQKIMPEVSVEILNSGTLTLFFKKLNERKRIVGKGQVKTGIKKSTIATYRSKLNSFFEWLKVKKHIEQNPFNEMVYPSHVYEDRKFLSKSDVEKILTAILKNQSRSLLVLKRNLVIFHLLLFCGLRREELLLLQLRDIDLERRILTIRAETSKVPRTRYIPLHSQLVMYLKDYLQIRIKCTTQYLLVSKVRDERLSYHGLNHFVSTIKNISGVKFYLHQFRHTFAVNFLKANKDIVKLKQLMGHRDIRTTLIYLRCLPINEMRGDIENMSIDNFA